MAWMHRRSHATREARSVEARDLQPAIREDQAGPNGVAERSVVPKKPGNAGRGKGPWFKVNAGRGESRESDVSLQPPAKVSEATGGVARQSEGVAELSERWSGELAEAVDAHLRQRLRRWLCCRHKIDSSGWSRYPDAYLNETLGLVKLSALRRRLPWAKA